MDVNVDKNSYIPDSQENVVFNALKNTNVSFVLILLIIIAIYIGIFFLVGNLSSENTNPSIKMFIIILEIVLWISLIGIVYINIKNYDHENSNFKIKMENLFNTKLANLKVETKTKKENEKSDKPNKPNKSDKEECKDNNSNKEVFHIANNLYSYQEARDVCEKYDATMANYEQIERAYNNGANWCSYGWSKDQLALFPTQQELYNELKKIPGHQHDCGRPGINGGYIKNKNVRFGVNCYGIKPKKNEKDEIYMQSIKSLPISSQDKKEENNIVAPFNKNEWSKYNKTNNKS